MSSNEIIETEGMRVEEPPQSTSNEVEKPEVQEKKPAPIVVKAEKDGLLIGHTLDEQKVLAKMWHTSGVVPKSYKQPAQVLAGLQFAIGVGLAPSVASLRNIAVINGQPSMWGELPLELVRKSGELEHFDEYLIDKDKNRIEYLTSWDMIFAAVCEIQRKDEPLKKFTWTKFQADKAIKGIDAIWKGYYDVMMKRKCRAVALKDVFTDVLGSRPIAEYDFHFAPDAEGMEKKLKDVTPTSVGSDMEYLT